MSCIFILNLAITGLGKCHVSNDRPTDHTPPPSFSASHTSFRGAIGGLEGCQVQNARHSSNQSFHTLSPITILKILFLLSPFFCCPGAFFTMTFLFRCSC